MPAASHLTLLVAQRSLVSCELLSSLQGSHDPGALQHEKKICWSALPCAAFGRVGFSSTAAAVASRPQRGSGETHSSRMAASGTLYGATIELGSRGGGGGGQAGVV